MSLLHQFIANFISALYNKKIILGMLGKKCFRIAQNYCTFFTNMTYNKVLIFICFTFFSMKYQQVNKMNNLLTLKSPN